MFNQTTIDSLTGVYNRKHFLNQFDNELQRADRENKQITLLVFDINHFEKINDKHGDVIGDRVLQIVTRVVKNALRDIDIFGRLGVEEFGVVLPYANMEIAQRIAARLRQQINNMNIVICKKSINISVSLGIVATEGKVSSNQLIQQADEALYAAKHRGRDTAGCHASPNVFANGSFCI